MGAAFIGGNLASIESAAARLVDSGTEAVGTGEKTKAAAVELNDAVEAAMSSLLKRFEGVSADLTNDISAAHRQLQDSDWQGASRDNALAIKADLESQVRGVLEQATLSLQEEQRMFTMRSSALVAGIQDQFVAVMGNVNEEYDRLATASRTTLQNLEAADQTIRMG